MKKPFVVKMLVYCYENGSGCSRVGGGDIAMNRGVGEGGLEPPRVLAHQILSLTRMPIPPFTR